MIKKLLLSFGVIFAFAGYSFYERNHSTFLPDVAHTNRLAPKISGVSARLYKDGTYTGVIADAYYGNLQVKAIITNGKLTDVQFLQYPNDQPTSVQINTQAMPLWKQEVIQAQSAKVDVVSGATQSSSAFTQSLQSALDQAKE